MSDKVIVVSSENAQVKMTDIISKRSRIGNEWVFASGRIFRNGPGIVAQTTTGYLFNPILATTPTGEISAIGSTTNCFVVPGMTHIECGEANISDRRQLLLPTVISNPTKDQKVFYNLIGGGEDAIKLATAETGSTIHFFGEKRQCWVGKFSVDVIYVAWMTLIRKKEDCNEK